MARANRHYIPGHVWHLTHRCHKKEFLLRFGKDRLRWLYWLFEAKKRYGLCVLDYMVTSNHVHLLVYGEDTVTIPRSMQLIAGRTGQEYNQRKGRKGAFWEDRYHATAVETGRHLVACMVYIDLNIVRAGAVKHPKDWPFCGYNEIQEPRKRYRIIDYKRLAMLLDVQDIVQAQRVCRERVADALCSGSGFLDRKAQWTESLAVGSKSYLSSVKRQMGVKAQGRGIDWTGGGYALREGGAPYENLSDLENSNLTAKNSLPWDE